jgi:hypothetical protein
MKGVFHLPDNERLIPLAFCLSVASHSLEFNASAQLNLSEMAKESLGCKTEKPIFNEFIRSPDFPSHPFLVSTSFSDSG